MKKLSALTIALIASLVANALLIGLVAGAHLGKPKPSERGPGRANPDFILARSIQAVVPDAEREEIRAAFRQAFRESRDYIDAKRDAQARLRTAMLATPFDKAAVDQAFADIRAADAVLNERFQASLADQLSSLSAEEREALGARLKEMDEKFGRRRGGKRDGEGRRDAPPPRG